MTFRILDQVLQRAESAKSDSDFTYFFSLLLAGECLTKTTTLGLLSALSDDSNRNRYRLEHALVRSDGLGDWSRALEDACTGPASQYLLAEARQEQKEITQLTKQGEWQYDSVAALKEALDLLEIQSEDLPTKSDLKRWFRLFTTLRNKTRGHGAIRPAKAGAAAVHLAKSIQLIRSNLSLFRRQWAFLYRNISGKYRVSPISDKAVSFDSLKREATHSFRNGVYVHFGSPRLVPLLKSDPDFRDFFFANGGFQGKRYELLSYVTDDKEEGSAADYAVPPGTLPASETEGHGELIAVGQCFSNAPDPLPDYVPRPDLEQELFALLVEDRRPIITLVGKGGIGKTSLSIKVIQRLYETHRFAVVVWLSARDVDLQFSGPSPVRPLVVSPDEIARLYSSLVLSADELEQKGFRAREFFETQLESNSLGSCLYVFDNFETTQNPIEVFNWIDTFIRPPNKVLITTRMRDFKGDYPLEVGGMKTAEAESLIDNTSAYLGVQELLSPSYINELVQRSEGHPYVIKILLGEVAKARKLTSIERLVAGNDELLTALFERTYASLTPCAQRAFMTLAAWNSSVPKIALEAVLMRSISEREEIERGIETLLQYSLAELHAAPKDQQVFIRLPLVASAFGKKKLNISADRAIIQSDVELLQMFGPTRANDIHLGLVERLEKFISNISRRIEAGDSYDDYAPVLNMICRSYNPGWLSLAKWHMESGAPVGFELAKTAIRSYLENEPDDVSAAEAWRLLGRACYQTGDALGEVHAFIERSQIETVPFHDVSNSASKLNTVIAHQPGIWIDKDQRRAMALRLLQVLIRRRSEAGADDLSRMAWLALHIGQEGQARDFVQAGLKMEPENEHCRRIAERLYMNPE
jgi:hypothetical protein